jgi:hypothetical protein
LTGTVSFRTAATFFVVSFTTAGFPALLLELQLEKSIDDDNRNTQDRIMLFTFILIDFIFDRGGAK